MRSTVFSRPTEARPSLPRLFVVVELALVVLVPVLAFIGLRSILDSTAGTFVEQATSTDPGWRAPVDPSPVHAVIVADGDQLAAVAVITQPTRTGTGGGIIIVPPNLVVDQFLVSDRQLDDAALAVELALHLHIEQSWVVDAAEWATILDGATVAVDNPDPVPDDDGSILIPVGQVDVSAADTPAFLGRPAIGESTLSTVVRQQLWWESLMDSPPAAGSASEVGALLASVAAGEHAVELLPYVVDGEAVIVDEVAAEQLIRNFVPFPAGAELGPRLKATVLTRTTSIDPAELAAVVGRLGIEVVSIGNAAAFDDAPTQVIAPIVLQDPGAELHDPLVLLAEELGADIVWADEFDDGNAVTLVAGPDVRVES